MLPGRNSTHMVGSKLASVDSIVAKQLSKSTSSEIANAFGRGGECETLHRVECILFLRMANKAHNKCLPMHKPAILEAADSKRLDNTVVHSPA